MTPEERADFLIDTHDYGSCLGEAREAIIAQIREAVVADRVAGLALDTNDGSALKSLAHDATIGCADVAMPDAVDDLAAVVEHAVWAERERCAQLAGAWVSMAADYLPGDSPVAEIEKLLRGEPTADAGDAP